MSVDNTHIKYLKGKDKKIWNNYKEAYEATSKLDNFISGLGKIPSLSEGEEYEIPVKKK
jgi:hypothetical protein